MGERLAKVPTLWCRATVTNRRCRAVSATVPARQSWSFIVSSHERRTFVKNRDMKPGVNSRDNPEVNKDGSPLPSP